MANQIYYVTTQTSLEDSIGSYVKDYSTKQIDNSIKVFIDANDLQKWYEYPTHFWVSPDHSIKAPDIPVDANKQKISKLQADNDKMVSKLQVMSKAIAYLQRQLTLNNNK